MSKALKEKRRRRAIENRLALPLRPIIDSGTWINAGATLRGAIITCISEWWMAGCPDNALQGNLKPLSRLGCATYIKLEKPLKVAIEEIRGAIKDVYDEKTTFTAKQAAQIEKSTLVLLRLHEKRKREKQERVLLADKNESNALSFQPLREDRKAPTSWQDNGKTDEIKRQNALNRIKSSPKEALKGTLKDV